MANDKDFYAVLGVTPEDDVTIIKRRYRQLVRENHPDIATDRASAHEMMLSINEAWTILSDPAERARYDRSRAPVVVPKKKTPADSYVASAARSNSASARTAPPRAAPSRTTARGSGQTRTRLLTMVFEAAELYFFQGRAEDAIDICNRVMKADPHNAEAPALLGDIYAEQGRRDVAVQMYQTAVRNQPNNALYRQKLEALGGQSEAPAAAAPSARAATPSRPAPRAAAAARPAASRAAPARAVPMRGSELRASLAQKDALRTRFGFAMLAVAIAALIWGCVGAEPDASPIPFLPGSASVPETVLFTTALGALFVGMALPLLDFLPRVATLRPSEPRWLGVPLLIAIVVAGMTAFPLAAVIFFLVSVARKQMQRGWLMVFLVCLAISSTVALALKDDRLIPEVLLQTSLWWSGRLVLPLFVFGWALGSQAARK
ncbi:MAG TPA: DnaJ domain-containing protein [Abditibacteriaceae bacterium]|jgi:curved DNA-binding protein CbpA